MILAQELVKKYADTTAVNGLSLAISAGQFFGLLGPNGSGKTTTIHLLATLLAPTSGSICIDGLDATKKPVQVRKKVGLVFQDSSLDRTMSIEENLLFSGGLYGLSRRSCLARMDELLPLFELQGKRHAKVASLSGGMRRAVDLLRGVLHEPRVLFLDEPTVGLDLPSRKRLWRFVQTLIADRRLTVVLTTHYLEEAASCDQVCFIRNGAAITTGEPNKLMGALGDAVLEIETSRAAACVTALRLAEGDYLIDGSTLLVRRPAGPQSDLEEAQSALAGQADALRVRKPNLNDVFLWLTDSGRRAD